MYYKRACKGKLIETIKYANKINNRVGPLISFVIDDLGRYIIYLDLIPGISFLRSSVPMSCAEAIAYVEGIDMGRQEKNIDA